MLIKIVKGYTSQSNVKNNENDDNSFKNLWNNENTLAENLKQ